MRHCAALTAAAMPGGVRAGCVRITLPSAGGAGDNVRLVKKAAKAILIGLAALPIVGLGIVFGVEKYLQSPSGQVWIQARLSRALNLPVTIEKTRVKLGDLRMTGVTVRDGDLKVLTASALGASYRLWPLLRGRLSIYEVNFEDPKVVLAKNADGKWTMPNGKKAPAKPTVAAEVKAPAPAVPVMAPPVAAAPLPTKPAPTEAAAPAPPVAKVTTAHPMKAPSPDPTAASVASEKDAVALIADAPKSEKKPKSEEKPKSEKPPKKKSWFQIVVEGGQLRRGSVDLLTKEHLPLATVTEINISYLSPNVDRAEGSIEVGRIVWANNNVFEKVRVPFSYLNGTLEVPEVKGTYGNGPFAGNASWKTRDPGSPFVAGLKFENIDLDRLTRDTEEPLGQAMGILSGVLNLRGSAEAREQLSGEGHLTVREGRFRDFVYFTMIGQPLGIDRMADVKVKELVGDLHIANEHVYIDKLAVDAEELQLNAQGVARFDGKLQVAARLSVQESLVAEMPAANRERMTVNGGARFIDFKLTGKTHKPKTDLADRVAGQTPALNFDQMLASILETAKKRSLEKKTKDKSDKKPKDSEGSATGSWEKTTTAQNEKAPDAP